MQIARLHTEGKLHFLFLLMQGHPKITLPSVSVVGTDGQLQSFQGLRHWVTRRCKKPQIAQHHLTFTPHHINIDARRSKADATFRAASIQKTPLMTPAHSWVKSAPLKVTAPELRLFIWVDYTIQKAAPDIRNIYLADTFPNFKTLTTCLKIFKSHRKMTK